MTDNAELSVKRADELVEGDRFSWAGHPVTLLAVVRFTHGRRRGRWLSVRLADHTEKELHYYDDERP